MVRCGSPCWCSSATPPPRPRRRSTPTEARAGAAPPRRSTPAPAIVALYGPILDVHSVGELAMTKMTVLYAVLRGDHVAVRRPPAHPRGRGERPGRAARRHGGHGRTRPLAAAVAFGAGVVAASSGLLAAAGERRRRPAGRRVAGVRRRPGPGVGLVATRLTALACQLSPSARTCAAIAAAGDRLALFVLRAVGDTTDGPG